MADPRTLRSDWPEELKLVVDLSRSPADPALDGAISERIANGRIDWSKFLELVRFHRLESLAALNFSEREWAGCPEEVREMLSRRLQRSGVRSLAMTRATLEVAAALKAAGIESLLLKGPSVSRRLYHRINARHSVDIDILLHEADVFKAHEIVRALGFRQTIPGFEIPEHCRDSLLFLAHDLSFIRDTDKAQLELHWRLFPNPLLLDWDLKACLQKSEILELGDTRINVLRLEELAVYLCCHGAKHGWFRMKWLADLDRILEVCSDAQLAGIRQIASENSVGEVVSSSMKLAAFIYASDKSDRNRAVLQDPTASEAFLRFSLRRLAKPIDWSDTGFSDLGSRLHFIRFLLRLKQGFAYKRMEFVLFLASKFDIETLSLPRRWLWLYALLGPLLAAIRVLRKSR